MLLQFIPELPSQNGGAIVCHELIKLSANSLDQISMIHQENRDIKANSAIWFCRYRRIFFRNSSYTNKDKDIADINIFDFHKKEMGLDEENFYICPFIKI